MVFGQGKSSKTKAPATEESVPELESEAFKAEAASTVKSYDAIPVLEQTKLPRGGVSVDTKAVGRVQYGIPPETIKDSMKLGIPVPQVYIVPVERFCREMGPALGVNLAEFEFPAYFNFFVYKKRCTLIVDSEDAEENIRRVFSETLLGPAQFRREDNPKTYEDEDFDSNFPREAIPNFAKELEYFRIMPDGKELVIETLLDFHHFHMKSDGHENLGVPPPIRDSEGKVVSPALSEDDDEKIQAVLDVAEDSEPQESVPESLIEVEQREDRTPWTYSQAKFTGDVATIWPTSATEEEKKNRSVPRLEVFKMPGGTEYIIHDVDVNNHIIGKARFFGHVKVSEAMSVDGFGGHSILDDLVPKRSKSKADVTVPAIVKPPVTFHPPSFGCTVLGNSHGFDKSGSVSGYVLWINGRGVMIDPPPYSSATLEREGIRPRMIVGIILTHCHADHDAGAFQKVLTGSPVVVITTPTIYKSFIRKYAALSALSPALLRHSHRYKPAFIGQPLRFQGATFYFTYTLHTIPCVGFRVEWRGRSMVFTGDHFNSPPAIDKLESTGVLSKARADDLRNLPLQDTDVLLHEAGAPPIHTPLDVLLKLPQKVKNRLYVVHTSALPENCELKVAPTGTAGTIRLDQVYKPSHRSQMSFAPAASGIVREDSSTFGVVDEDIMWNGNNEYVSTAILTENAASVETQMLTSSFAHVGFNTNARPRSSVVANLRNATPPLVSLRPASSTDAWFILNLLSAVPFLNSLSYGSTMELLETAKVDAFSINSVLIPAAARSRTLCVIWEGTCAEKLSPHAATDHAEQVAKNTAAGIKPTRSSVWYAGDWTGPISLQPDFRMSGESDTSASHDIVAISPEGVKVITVEFSSLHSILKNGSPLYRKYLERKMNKGVQVNHDPPDHASSEHESLAVNKMLQKAISDLNILEIINCNSALRKLSAVQKRHLESLAEGPMCFHPGEKLWRSGAPVDKAFLVIQGTASFVPKRRNAGSAAVANNRDTSKDKMGDPSVGDSMRADAMKAIKELGARTYDSNNNDESSMSSAESEANRPFHLDSIFTKLKSTLEGTNGNPDFHDYERLSRGLQKRAEFLKEGSVASEISIESYEGDSSVEFETESHLDYTFTDDNDPGARSRRVSLLRRRSSRARFANKVLGRLYSRRAFTGGLVFSRGHFLGDVSKMVAGLLSTDTASEIGFDEDFGESYGFGDKHEGNESLSDNITELIIHEQEGDNHVMHSSTLTAGKDGCVVLLFPRASLIPFLDNYPGLLLSLLGTQVVV